MSKNDNCHTRDNIATCMQAILSCFIRCHCINNIRSTINNNNRSTINNIRSINKLVIILGLSESFSGASSSLIIVYQLQDKLEAHTRLIQFLSVVKLLDKV